VSGAARKRRYRERLRDGLFLLQIESERLWLAETLAAGGYLPSADQDDTQSLNAATHRLLAKLVDFVRETGRVPQGLHADDYTCAEDTDTDEGSSA
jgi:hypothetical protein